MSVAGEKTDVDLLVIGTGNGGLVAALCAYELGVQNVLVIEKSAKYGGTSGRSGGGVWVPWNRYAQAAGAQDSLEEGREYLRQTIPADQVPAEMLDTYIEQAPKMLDFLHERTRVRYKSIRPHRPPPSGSRHRCDCKGTIQSFCPKLDQKQNGDFLLGLPQGS